MGECRPPFEERGLAVLGCSSELKAIVVEGDEVANERGLLVPLGLPASGNFDCNDRVAGVLVKEFKGLLLTLVGDRFGLDEEDMARAQSYRENNQDGQLYMFDVLRSIDCT